MILDHTHAGRYVFLFDVNRVAPFDGKGIDWKIFRLEGDASGFEPYQAMRQWLADRTAAFRIEAALIRSSFNPQGWNIHVIAVSVPEELASLFKLFWF